MRIHQEFKSAFVKTIVERKDDSDFKEDVHNYPRSTLSILIQEACRISGHGILSGISIHEFETLEEWFVELADKHEIKLDENSKYIKKMRRRKKQGFVDSMIIKQMKEARGIENRPFWVTDQMMREAKKNEYRQKMILGDDY